MESFKRLAPQIGRAIGIAFLATIVGREWYVHRYAGVIHERWASQGQYGSLTVPGDWAWFSLTLVVAILGATAWKYFGWLTSLLIILTCTLGSMQIDYANDRHNHHPVHGQGFALQGGLLSGLLVAGGVGLAERRTPRERRSVQHLFAAMAAVGCVLACLRVYDWRVHEEYRQSYAQVGEWPDHWQVTEEDRRLSEQWRLRIESEEQERVERDRATPRVIGR